MKAYAKLNMYLRVLNKRDDGYHNLQMVNTKIDLYDIIDISKSNDVDKVIYINEDIVDTSPDNLILKVLKKFKEKYNIPYTYIIKIEKNIPYGAGLGGVSMDIGKIIEYICEKENIIITLDELINFTKEYGADIPYSFYDTACIVEGIGEIITPINIPEKELILVIPNIYISTKDIFTSHYIYNKEETHEEILNHIYNKEYINDLQITTTNINKELKELDNYLSSYGQSFMTGSGSCFVVDATEDKEKVVEEITNRYPLYKVKIIKTKEGN